MSIGNFSADTDGMRNVSNNVVGDSDDYKNAVTGIYRVIDNLKAGWQGEDNKAFADKTYEYKPAIDELGNVIEAYGNFVKASASDIDNLYSEIYDSANRL